MGKRRRVESDDQIFQDSNYNSSVKKRKAAVTRKRLATVAEPSNLVLNIRTTTPNLSTSWRKSKSRARLYEHCRAYAICRSSLYFVFAGLVLDPLSKTQTSPSRRRLQL